MIKEQQNLQNVTELPLNQHRLLLSLLAVWLFLSLPGCMTVGPDYVAPGLDAPDAWNTELKDGLKATPVDPQTLARWWTTLKDPILTSLIERAVAGNLDVKDALARVRQARANLRVSKADFLPSVDAVGSFQKSRSSENAQGGDEQDLSYLGFDSSWELDVFGGIRRSVEATTADLQVTTADLRDVLVSLLAEVALNYIEARTYQTRLAVSEENLKAQQETYDLAQSRYRAGLTTELAVQQAKYNMENTRSEIPTLRTGLDAAMNRLAVLLGEAPGAVHEDLKEAAPIPVTPLQVAVGVPADALRHRPDVRRAERELAAQTARVGVAVADLYPKLTLVGSIGLETLSVSDLFTAGSRTFSLGPSISWPIFHGGAIRANIEVQSALQEQSLIQYESTILNALEEVENGLVAYAEEQTRRESLRAATDAARQAVLLAQDQYRAGMIDFNSVLDAQRSLLSFQDQLAESDGTVTSNLVRLYKALGGGWTTFATS